MRVLGGAAIVRLGDRARLGTHVSRTWHAVLLLILLLLLLLMMLIHDGLWLLVLIEVLWKIGLGAARGWPGP